jgi:cobaltochelatase CobN
MKKFSLVYYSATGLEMPSFAAGLSAYRADGHEITVHAVTAGQIAGPAEQKAFVEKALKADALLITLHGGKRSFAAYSDLVKEMEGAAGGAGKPWIHLQPTSGDEDAWDAARDMSTDYGQSFWAKAHGYISNGGGDNYHQFLYAVHHRLFGEGPEGRPAERPATEGLYHPDFPNSPDLAEYLAQKYDPARPTLGLWFGQSFWLNRNLAHVDAIIRETESRGANIISFFHLRYKDVNRGNLGADELVEKYFYQNGRPLIEALISPMMFSLNLASPDYRHILKKLDVPVLQAINATCPRADWLDSLQGVPTQDVSFNVAQPEFDGNLITVPASFRETQKRDSVTGALVPTYEPDGERVAKVVGLALNWAALRRTPAAERRVAIIFHHYPPRNDRIGCASGLDSFASVSELLKEMKAAGYGVERVFDGENELAHELLDRVTCDRRWLTWDQMAARAEATAGPELYRPWHAALPENSRRKLETDWGPAPGDMFVHQGRMLFAGMQSGNVFITIQPSRAILDNVEKFYHDPHLSPPHYYLAQYRWLRDVFKAQAVIHVGKHGSLEWLPGKGLGLSAECWPDLALMDFPNIYPYIINDPGEGTQAKRRAHAAIVDHLPPAFTNADLYDDLAGLEKLLSDYQLALAEDPGKTAALQDMIWEAVEKGSLDKDLNITRSAALLDFEAFLERLHSYLHELSDTMIGDGLHVLGRTPSGGRLVEYLVQMTRLENDGAPSLRESLARAQGFDYDELLDKRGRPLGPGEPRTGGQVIARLHEQAVGLVSALAENDYQELDLEALVSAHLGKADPEVEKALGYIREELVSKVRLCCREIDSVMSALAGGFIEPGPSGAPTRGQADILPTGRNFYSVDPEKIPSPAAWKIGVCLGDALLERCLADTGAYPENVGIIIFASGTMRTRGDDVAEALYLMGVKPAWRKGGGIAGLEVIPAAELGRPRLDVTPRITGLFRDTFPAVVELLDDAVQMVAGLKEEHGQNYLRRNVYKDLEHYRAQGLSEEEAWRESTFRVFGCPPGTYAAGVKELVGSKQWQNQQDLGNAYIHFSGYAYGRGQYGLKRPENFRRGLARMDLTVKNEDSREYDLMSCTDFYNYYGGLIVAAKTVRGALPLALAGDSSDPGRVKVRSTFEEAKHILRSRLVNPKWIQGLKRHGYKGAGDISKMMDVMFGWDATAELMEDWMYEKAARSYALDPEMREWMKAVNPYALQNILNKLLEAISRGMWRASEEMERDLRDAYLEMEGEIEEWTDSEPIKAAGADG